MYMYTVRFRVTHGQLECIELTPIARVEKAQHK